MNPELSEYIENCIIPRYASFDKAHREDHARAVIERALAMGKAYDIDPDMLLTAAACHDLGLSVDRKTHHLESGRIIREDKTLRKWFSEEQIETIAQAAEDHRASATTPPRSIYGRLVAEADRMIVPETIIRRTVLFGFDHYPTLDKEGHWQRTLEHLHEKYAEGGYLHLLIPGSPNEEPLQRLREIIKDEKRVRDIFEEVYRSMTSRKHLAAEKKRCNSHNCAQAVVCTYCDLVGLSEDTAMKIAGAYGTGMGNMEGTCGAIVGAGMILGLARGDRNAARADMKTIMTRFQERNGATRCKLLKGIGSGKPLRDCPDCVSDASEFLEDLL